MRVTQAAKIVDVDRRTKKNARRENCCEIPLNYACLFYLPIDLSSRHVVCSLPHKLLYRHHWVIGSLASTPKPSRFTHRKARRMSRPKVLSRVILIVCGIAIGSFVALTAFSNKPQSQRRIVTTTPPIFSKVKKIQIVDMRVISDGTPGAGVSVEIRNNSETEQATCLPAISAV